MNQTTPPPTIPHIAEILRTYVKSSNDAPRLIIEHILPVIGVTVDTVGEIQDAPDRIETLKTLLDNTRVRLTRLASTARENSEAAKKASRYADMGSIPEDALDTAQEVFARLAEDLDEIAEELENA